MEGASIMSTKMKRHNFFCPDDLDREIRARGDLSDVVRESLTRYFAIMKSARETMQDAFSPEDLSFMVDVNDATVFDAATLEGVMWNVEDANEAAFASRNVDREALLVKLRGLTICQHAALVDALERYYRATSTGILIDSARILYS